MATIYTRGRAKYLQWSEAGQQMRVSLGAVTDAEAEASRLAKERELAGFQSAAGPIFDDWAVEYAAWHSVEYPDSYFRVEQILRMYLRPHFGLLAIGTIDKRTVEGYKHARLAAGASPATVTKELRTLQAAINRAVDWEIIPHNPIHGVKPPRNLNHAPPRWYTADELQRIYAAEANIRKCTSPANAGLHQAYRWTWQLLANTGMRRTEGLKLKWGDIGRDEIRIHSTQERRTKSGRWRIVPITAGAEEAIDALNGKGKQTEKKDRHVIPHVTAPALSKAFTRTLARAQLDGHIHCLRHTYGVHLVTRNVPIRTIQTLMGHASVTTTEVYTQVVGEHLKAPLRDLAL